MTQKFFWKFFPHIKIYIQYSFFTYIPIQIYLVAHSQKTILICSFSEKLKNFLEIFLGPPTILTNGHYYIATQAFQIYPFVNICICQFDLYTHMSIYAYVNLTYIPICQYTHMSIYPYVNICICQYVYMSIGSITHIKNRERELFIVPLVKLME